MIDKNLGVCVCVWVGWWVWSCIIQHRDNVKLNVLFDTFSRCLKKLFIFPFWYLNIFLCSDYQLTPTATI